MVKAGLLPRLSNQIIAVYVEATGDETETGAYQAFGDIFIELGHDRSELPAVVILAKALRKILGGKADRIGIETFKRPKAARTYGGMKWSRQ